MTNKDPNEKTKFAKFSNGIATFGRGIGAVVNALYDGGRKTIDMMIKNVIPFIAFIALIIGFILKTGVGHAIATGLAPLASNFGGLIILGLIVGIPVLSPVLGPGAVIAQVIGTIVGALIVAGKVPPQMALPAFFAIDVQVGCDFIPVGLALGEAQPKTVEVGVPAVLFSREITGVIAITIAYFASFGMFPGH